MKKKTPFIKVTKAVHQVKSRLKKCLKVVGDILCDDGGWFRHCGIEHTQAACLTYPSDLL